MKRVLLLAALALAMSAPLAYAEPVRDGDDLRAAHEKVQEALKDLERAQKANHYDMGGHAAKAEQALRNAEQEMALAVEFVRRDHDKRDRAERDRDHDRRDER